MKTILPKRLAPQLADASTTPLSLQPDVLTDVQCAQFLDLIALGDSQHRAASKIGAPFRLISATCRANPRFAEILGQLIQDRSAMMGSVLEDVMFREATEGVEEDVYHMGLIVGTKRVHPANAVGQFMLRGLMREKYGTERVDSNVNVAAVGPPPAVRSNEDAQRLLAKTRAMLALPVIEGQFEEVKPDSDEECDLT